MDKKRYLVITVDTEPDNQWERAHPPYEYENTRNIGKVHEVTREEGFIPTYLVSYSVVQDSRSREALQHIAANDECEIGTHLHPWETPPFTELDQATPPVHPYQYEYPWEISFQKLNDLHTAIGDAFGFAPTSYRAGRWGLDPAHLADLATLGYTVDTSMACSSLWRKATGATLKGPRYRRFSEKTSALVVELCDKSGKMSNIIEVPVTILYQGIAKSRWLWERFASIPRVEGGLKRLGIGREVWLRPGFSPARVIKKAMGALAGRGKRIFNLIFHSSEAWEGTSPLTRSGDDAFYGAYRELLRFFRKELNTLPLILKQIPAMRQELGKIESVTAADLFVEMPRASIGPTGAGS